jgi:hypothetical protein
MVRVSLCPFHKKDGGIRPIAIENCLQRLTSKLACFQSRNIVNSYLSPHQLGVATKLACEAAIHTTRIFVNNDQNRGKVHLKLDFKNPFNSVERDCILKEVQCHTPLLFSYHYQWYRNPSTLFFGDHLISSSVGAQQGDICGLMIFSFVIQPIILSLDSQLNIWYLDNGTLADYPEVVLSDFKKVINLSRKIGLELNFNKCKIFCCSGDRFKSHKGILKLVLSYFQVCIGLILGCNLSTSHICKCNAKVDENVLKAVIDFPDALKLLLLSTGL